MKLLMTSQKTTNGRKVQLVHRENLYSGTRCGCELSNPTYFDGDESLITCSRCAKPEEKRGRPPQIKPVI